MLYLAPVKYYKNGQLRLFDVIEDFLMGNIPLAELQRIEHNLQLLDAKQYKAFIRELNRKERTY